MGGYFSHLAVSLSEQVYKIRSTVLSVSTMTDEYDVGEQEL